MSSADDFKSYLAGFKAGAIGRDSFTTQQVDQLTARVDTLIAELNDDNSRLVAEKQGLLSHLESARMANEALVAQLNQPPAPPPSQPVPSEPVIAQQAPVVSEPAASAPVADAPVSEDDHPAA